MRSHILSNSFKWITMQWPRSVVHSSPGFGSSVVHSTTGFDSSVFQQSKSVCNESKMAFPLFSKTFSSAVSLDKDETKTLASTGKGKSQKGLYYKVSSRGPKTVSVLEKWLNDGNVLMEGDVQSIVRSLRVNGKYIKALEVSEWMQNHKKFEFTAGDYAIQLDLIAKVHGVSRAEKYFNDLAEFAKNESTYCTLLHCYCKERLTEKAEHWMGKIQELGFDKNVLPYNTLMDLYIANGEMEKVLSTINHLKKMDVKLDVFTYSLWISACASLSGIDDVEKIVDEIKAIGDDSVRWTIYSALANMYIKAGLVGKAESALKELEKKITERDRTAYDHLLTMYATLGNKEEVYRVWKSLKTSFNKLSNQNYTSVLSSLVKVGDVEGAEKIFKEWESSGVRYDCRIANILLAAYVREGMLEKAEKFHGHIVENGGKPNCRSWEILMEGYLESKQMDKAVATMMKALSRVKYSDWKPRSENVMGILKYFEKQGDVERADAFLKLLRDIKCVSTKTYNSIILTYVKAGKSADKIFEQMVNDNVSADEETEKLRKIASDKLSG